MDVKEFTNDMYEIGPLSVSSLIDQNSGRWNQQLLHTLFWIDDINAILQVPVLGSNVPDRRIWHYTRFGTYFVRSCYYLAREMRVNNISMRTEGCGSHGDYDWNLLLQLPNKIKVFMWRALNHAIPVLDNMRRRR